jgi:glycosyltransferase involved in cell wall biosynthesis
MRAGENVNICIISPTLPVPTSGGRTRVYNLLRHLSRDHQITLLTFVQPADERWAPTVLPYCHRLEGVPFAGWQPLGAWQNRLRGWGQILFSRRPRYAATFPVETMREPLRRLLRESRFDVVTFETLYLVELVGEIGDAPRLLAEQNAEHDVARRSYELATHPVHRVRDGLEWRKLRAFESAYLRRFPTCVAVSERDAALLAQLSPATRYHVAPNGVDGAHFAPPAGRPREGQTLLFFGTLNYGPNVEGIVWFVEEVLPRIRQADPQVTLEIVGADAAPAVAALATRPGVKLTGFAPDIRERLWSATLSVVPLWNGGGTRLKILEALAAGCPVVSTSLGAEGLDLQDEEHLLIADSAEAFASQVVRALASPELRESLAQRGQERVALRYDWGPIAERFEAALQDAARLPSAQTAL